MQSSSQNVTINKPTPSFLQAGCPSCRQTKSVKALKGKVSRSMDLLTPSTPGGLRTLSLTMVSDYFEGGLPSLSSTSDPSTQQRIIKYAHYMYFRSENKIYRLKKLKCPMVCHTVYNCVNINQSINHKNFNIPFL